MHMRVGGARLTASEPYCRKEPARIFGVTRSLREKE
jgi:hypothetical protein